jgi:anti-anti-sigma regulatory factor/DICT domain-containing protein
MTMSNNAPISVSLFSILKTQLGERVKPFMATKASLVDMSHTLEDVILKHKLPSVVFTGFQESSHWKEETARYLELTGIAQQICIFAGGNPPVPEEKHIAVTLQGEDPLRQEWFLLILSEKFSAVLCGLDNKRPVNEEARRSFETILSYDPALIQTSVEHILPVVERYRPDRAAELRAAVVTFPPKDPDGAIMTELSVGMLSHLQHRYDEQVEMVGELHMLRDRQMRLETVISELAVPVVPLLNGVIILPLVGTFDTRRAQQVMESLLTGIAEQQADVAIIDITGVPLVDTAVANYLIQAIRAANLLGAHVILTGIGSQIAQTLVMLGVDFSRISTRASLRDGIEAALELQGMRIG